MILFLLKTKDVVGIEIGQARTDLIVVWRERTMKTGRWETLNVLNQDVYSISHIHVVRSYKHYSSIVINLKSQWRGKL